MVLFWLNLISQIVYSDSPNIQIKSHRIMPLGDSITASSSGQASYRYYLWKLLASDGQKVDFVGSKIGVKGGSPQFSDFDQDHEGHWGWRADEILEKIEVWCKRYKPDTVLIHLGTNDIFQGQTTESTAREIENIIVTLRSSNRSINILIAQLIPGKGFEKTIRELNNKIENLAKLKHTHHSPVIAVDQFSGFEVSNDTWDGYHPNKNGDKKMAKRWYLALRKLNRYP